MDLEDSSNEYSEHGTDEARGRYSDPEVEISDFEDPTQQIRFVDDDYDESLDTDYSVNSDSSDSTDSTDSASSSDSTIDDNDNNESPLDLSTNDDHNNSHEASSNNLRNENNVAHNSEDSDIVFVQSVANLSTPQVFTVNSDSESSDIEPIVVRAPPRNSRDAEIRIMELIIPNLVRVSQPPAPSPEPSPIEDQNLSADISNTANAPTDSDNCCIICTDLYTNSDQHHVVSLKCGHLFGRSCIETWLQPNRHSQRCPQCNKPAKKRDILKIYARNLRPLDTWERDEFVKKLKVSETNFKKLETETKSIRAENSKLHIENEELKSRLMNCQCHSNFESKKNPSKFQKFSMSKKMDLQLAHIKEIDLKASGARHHCYFKLNDSLVANISRSQNSPLNFSNFGIVKESLIESNNSKADYIFMHKKPIKGMVANQQDGSLVTVSADKTMKVSSIIAKTNISTTDLNYEPCSVEILPQSDIIFVGMKNGTVDLFDRRYLNQPVKTLASQAPIPSPVVSMSLINCKNPETKALLAVHLDSCWLHAFQANTFEASSIQLPYVGKSISCDHDPKSGYTLISFRPSLKHQKMTHYIFDWSYDPQTKEIQPRLHKKLEGGTEQIQMARSKIHSNPLNPGSVLVCGPDDRACGAMIWDCKSDFTQPISTYRPLYDFQFIDYSSFNTPILSCLGEGFLKLYKMY